MRMQKSVEMQTACKLCSEGVVKVQREGRATAARKSHVITGIDMHAREDDANLP